jgi:hypothetical protein
MNNPIYVDTSHLTERQKCILALEQAISNGHRESRVHELKERLMKLSIMTLDDDEREVLDYWGE